VAPAPAGKAPIKKTAAKPPVKKTKSPDDSGSAAQKIAKTVRVTHAAKSPAPAKPPAKKVAAPKKPTGGGEEW